MYRPEIKVLDCTIRDGGLMNNWDFSIPMVREVFDGLAKAGVDYVELGYRADKKQFSPEDHGPWRFCDEEVIREVAYPCDTKVSIMCDIGRTDMDTILPSKDSLVGMYRVACYVQDVDKAIAMVEHIKALGYVVTVNLMAVSTNTEAELDVALDALAASSVDIVYLVDSFGYFYSEHVHYLADKYLDRLPGKEIGIHCHNNQQLAFSNSVESILQGINYIDGSIYGMGRAAGNCTTELILGFLSHPKYNLSPVLDLIERYFQPLKEDLKWGYELPYMVTGILNAHPRSALAYMKDAASGKEQESLADFYASHVQAQKEA